MLGRISQIQIFILRSALGKYSNLRISHFIPQMFARCKFIKTHNTNTNINTIDKNIRKIYFNKNHNILEYEHYLKYSLWVLSSRDTREVQTSLTWLAMNSTTSSCKVPGLSTILSQQISAKMQNNISFVLKCYLDILSGDQHPNANNVYK